MKNRYGFVSNSSSTSMIVDLLKLNNAEEVELKEFIGWMDKKEVPIFIDIDTSEAQYCYLDENRVLIYCRGDSIPDWLYESPVREPLEIDEIKGLPFDSKICISPILSILSKHGISITNELEKDIAKEVMRLLLVDEY